MMCRVQDSKDAAWLLLLVDGGGWGVHRARKFTLCNNNNNIIGMVDGDGGMLYAMVDGWRHARYLLFAALAVGMVCSACCCLHAWLLASTSARFSIRGWRTRIRKELYLPSTSRPKARHSIAPPSIIIPYLLPTSAAPSHRWCTSGLIIGS